MVKTLADIVPNGAATPLTADRSKISRGWVCVAASGDDARVGDSAVGAAQGQLVKDGGSFFFPAPPHYGDDAYNLADLYAYMPAGTGAVTITYEE